MNQIARKVNQQICFVQSLIQGETEDDSVRGKALVQGGYLQLELCLFFYICELSTKESLKEEIEYLGLPHVVSTAGVLQRLASQEAKELTSLFSESGSWLANFMAQLSVIRASWVDQSSLIGSIFSSIEESPSTQGGDLLSVTNITNKIEEPSFIHLKACFDGLKEMVQRHRAVNEEY